YRFNAFPKLINNLKKAGKPKMVIIVAIMRKLAKPAYYIVKTGQPYDEERHRLNQ
ncbi:IS110 family transposase, partial [Neisseria gonorrhoeae]